MKKLLLLLFVIVGIVGCDKAEKDQSLTPFQESLKLAYDYGVDTVGISYLRFDASGTPNEILFNYVQNNKLKASQYHKSTKMLLYEVEDNEPFKWEIKYNAPYVGEVIERIKDFTVIFHDKNLANVYYMLNSQNEWGNNNHFEKLFFIKDKIACKKMTSTYSNAASNSGTSFGKTQKWYDNSWIIHATEWTKDNNGVTEKSVVNCYDKFGDLLFSCKSLVIPNIPLNMSEGITLDKLDVSRINIRDNNISWTQTINLNIPETAKYELTKSELVDTNTVKATYNITLYDGTKTTKTVNVNVNTGEYTLI